MIILIRIFMTYLLFLWLNFYFILSVTEFDKLSLTKIEYIELNDT